MNRNNKEHDRGDFLAASMRAVASEVINWSGESRVLQTLRTELDQAFERCTDPAFAERYHSFIKIGQPSDYLSRVVEADGVRALAGIHFCGRDTNKPFVNISAMDGKPTRWSGVVEALLEAFRVFQPRVCRIQSAGSEPPFEEAGLRVVGDQLVVAERVGRMMSDGLSTGPVSLRDAQPQPALEFVSRMYEQHLRLNPKLVGRVEAATQDQLQGCSEHGVLAWWCVDDDIAGLIAASPDSGFGIEGWVVMEEVVDPKFSGRGSAALAQREVAGRIFAKDQDAVLFGTIDFVNTASRRSAARAGRKEIAGWWFVQPAEPGADSILVW
ncbi:MAG: hypothetical protein ACIAQF_02005 [Phycisphaerales bacterium JB065]